MASLRVALIVMAAVFAAVAGLYAYQALSAGATQAVCGDGKCSASENCASCPQDCVCAGEAYCSTGGKCITLKCGDGACSPGESSVECCDDCGCHEQGTVCDTRTHACSFPEAPLSDDDAAAAVRAYYSAQNISITKLQVTGSSVSGGKPVKVVSVFLEGDPYERLVAVGAGGNITEEIFRW